MAGIRGRVMEVTEADMEWNISILLERDVSVLPGQYLKVRQAEHGQLFSTTVFPIMAVGRRLQVMPISQPNWSAGEEIQIYGPFGKGFTLPTHKSRVGIYVPPATPALCLLPLIEQALPDGHEVALVSDSFLGGLLAEVEVLTSDRARDVFAWADYLVTVAKFSEVNAVAFDLKVFRSHINRTGEDQLLVLAEMPCTGIAACEMCTVQTKKGWKHACKDGPVFNLAEIGLA